MTTGYLFNATEDAVKLSDSKLVKPLELDLQIVGSGYYSFESAPGRVFSVT